MKYFWSFLVIALLASLQIGQAQGRPINVNDLWAMGRVSDPHISPDGEWVAYTVKYYDMETNKSNSDIYLVSADGKTTRQLTTASANDYSPRWSRDGGRLAFISTRDGSPQIYIISLSGGEAEKATSLPTGVESFEWSPDNAYFAIFTSVYPEAKTPEESAKMEEQKAKSLATGRIIDELMYRHWNQWREGKYSHVVVLPASGGEAVDITPGKYDTPPISLGSKHDFVWSPDSRQICFVRNPDPVVAVSTNNDLWLTPASGGQTKNITEENKANDNGPRFSPDGRYLAYMAMSRPGFESDQQDLMVVDLQSGARLNLTEKLDRYVSDFVWAPDGKKLYFYVPHHGRHRLFEVDLKKRSPRLVLDGHYISGMDISPDGKFLVLTRQAINLPTELYRLDIRSRKLTRLTHTNDARLSELEMNPLEEFWFTGANGDSVHLLMVKPPAFNADKKYPLISLVHGGPQGAWGDDFHYRWNAEMFASPGYVVIMINFHGSRGYGQKFCDAVTHNWGGWPYEDVMEGTRWAVRKFDFIDGNRVGAAGASYGGFMLNWIEGHNDEGLFKVLVSHDGVYEQVSMFGATEELWFPIWEFNGRPWDEGSLYQKWNPANYVTHFKTPMLIIHGEKDYRVPYTQGLQLFTALQLQGVDSRLLFFPDEDHWVLKPQNARMWWSTVYDWLARYLIPGQ